MLPVDCTCLVMPVYAPFSVLLVVTLICVFTHMTHITHHVSMYNDVCLRVCGKFGMCRHMCSSSIKLANAPTQGGGIWQRLGVDRSRTPRRNLVADVPLGPPVPLEHSKGPQALVWRQHCRDTFLHNTESTVKLHATIKKATDAGAVGAEDFARAGASGNAPKNLARD